MEKPSVPTQQKAQGGIVRSVGNLARELFGQLLSARFWKDLLVFTLKTAFRVGGEMAIVAGGHALIEMGKRFGKGNVPELEAIKDRFSTLQPAAPAPAPAATAWTRGFNPGSEYRPNQPVPTENSAWPGLAPNFGR